MAFGTQKGTKLEIRIPITTEKGTKGGINMDKIRVMVV